MKYSKYSLFLVLAGASILVMTTVSCRRTLPKTAKIYVSPMETTMDVRIVTNAVNNEITGKLHDMRGLKNDCEIDIANGIIMYHEGPQLRNYQYLQTIETCIKEVGYNAKVKQVRFNPVGEFKNPNGKLTDEPIWHDRFTAYIEVKEVKTIRDANIIVDAIAFARMGRRDDPRIKVDAQQGTVNVSTYESLHMIQRNIEDSIVCVGYNANHLHAYFGKEDAIRDEWRPISLAAAAPQG